MSRYKQLCEIDRQILSSSTEAIISLNFIRETENFSVRPTKVYKFLFYENIFCKLKKYWTLKELSYTIQLCGYPIVKLRINKTNEKNSIFLFKLDQDVPS